MLDWDCHYVTEPRPRRTREVPILRAEPRRFSKSREAGPALRGDQEKQLCCLPNGFDLLRRRLGIGQVIDQNLKKHPDKRYGMEGREDDGLIRDEEHGCPCGESGVDNPNDSSGLSDQVRYPMKCADRSVPECPQVDPQTMKAALRRVHPLAVQTAVSVDTVMSMTFCTHERSIVTA